MKNLNAWLVTLAGVLLVLNVSEVINVLEGVGGWALAIVVLLIGITQLVKSKK